MSVDITPRPGINITVVYADLPLDKINRDRLRKAFTTTQVILMDTPELIFGFTPPGGLTFQIGDQRVRLNDPLQMSPTASQLAKLADKFNQIVSQKTVAYGFNYEFGLSTTDATSMTASLKQRYLPNEEVLALRLNAEIRSMVPRIILFRNDIRYDLAFQLQEDDQVTVHANVHFVADALPKAQALQEIFNEQYAAAQDLITGLLRD